VYKNSEIPYKPSVYLFICSFFFPMWFSFLIYREINNNILLELFAVHLPSKRSWQIFGFAYHWIRQEEGWSLHKLMTIGIPHFQSIVNTMWIQCAGKVNCIGWTLGIHLALRPSIMIDLERDWWQHCLRTGTACLWIEELARYLVLNIFAQRKCNGNPHLK
jgi:hypothetical protein